MSGIARDVLRLYDNIRLVFGKKYSEMMVDGHKDAIELFEKASIESTDPDIRAWANATLPILRTHLEHSLACQKACAKI